ncbi:MAG: undecaprenyl-diphosphatase, partial [Candidatus Omnitrophota bacterium]
GLRLTINTVVGFLPAVVIGLALNDLIKEYLFGLWPTVAAWLGWGIALLFIDRKFKARRESDAGLTLAELTWKGALIIGLMQCIAMWPGTSRSLVTILGGLFVGLKLRESVTFAFILGMVTLTAATAYDGLKHGELMLSLYGPTSLGVGMVVALISAIFAVKWMVAYLNKHGMAIFGYYRIVLALVVAGLLLSGKLTA